MDGCFFKPEELIRVFQTNAVLQRLSKTTEVRSDVNVCFAPKCGRCAEQSLIPKPVIPTCRYPAQVILG